MKRIGLTGSIGSGKSAVVAWLRAQGIAVHDADAAVHEIYARAETLEFIRKNFTDAVQGDAVDKNRLAQIVFEDADKKKLLESYFHPRVADHRADFMIAARKADALLAVCDIPLLFETQAENEFDETWLITAPDDIRLPRVLARPGMTSEKFTAINAAQMPQAEKIKRATHVIDNSGALDELHEKLSWLIGQK